MNFSLGIEDFDKLVDPRFLYDHCLGPEPSAYVQRLLFRADRSKFLAFIIYPRHSLFFVIPL